MEWSRVAWATGAQSPLNRIDWSGFDAHMYVQPPHGGRLASETFGFDDRNLREIRFPNGICDAGLSVDISMAPEGRVCPRASHHRF